MDVSQLVDHQQTLRRLLDLVAEKTVQDAITGASKVGDLDVELMLESLDAICLWVDELLGRIRLDVIVTTRNDGA